eukprot:5416651-Prymnesium_polylepis.1
MFSLRPPWHGSTVDLTIDSEEDEQPVAKQQRVAKPECPICLEEIGSAGIPVRALECLHLFWCARLLRSRRPAAEFAPPSM